MAGLNNIREAYEQVYAQMDEALSADEKALRRELAADKRASKMDAKVGAKYAGSEAQSAARADKKSKGKHIHGMADSYEIEGELVDEAKVDKKLPEHERSAARLKRYANPSGALALGGGQQRARRAEHEERRGVKKEELEMQLRAHLRERALDAAEKREKESVYKAIKPSKLAKTYPEKSPKEIKSLRYAISTSQAKKNMDTSRSDKRYGVER
jgi:hypothetical protein